MTWRDKFRPVIASLIIAANGGADVATLKTTFRLAWPADEPRQGYAYGIWRDEIARQLEQLGIKGVTRRKRKVPRGRKLANGTLRRLNRDEARAWLRRQQLKLFE